jgi:predicted RNA-binding Zn ribbon-like protein
MDFDGDSAEPLAQMEFLFLGGNLALDLVNTRRPRRLLGSRTIIQYDQLYDCGQAAAWWEEARTKHGLPSSEVHRWSDEEFELLLALRIELRALFEELREGRKADCAAPILNRLLARGSFFVRIEEGGVAREYASREGGYDPLLVIALAATRLLAKGDLSRLRACRSERCTLLFYDTTKSGTRHWCRPECMNRARARANYRKQKAGGEAAS